MNAKNRSLDIEPAMLRGFARSIAEIEWLLLLLVVLYLCITQPQLTQRPEVLALLGSFAAFVGAFRYLRVLAARPGIKIVIEILAMLAFVTGALAVTGGIRSPLLNLYLLPVITAALGLGKRAVALVVGLVICCYVLLAALASGPEVLGARLAGEAFGVLTPLLLVAFSTTLLAENINVSTQRIRALSDRDELTSLHNRGAFLRLAEREHSNAIRTGRPYSVLIIDVEGLKSINDTHGHDAGNRALKLVADALERLTRSSDIVARFGDDDFIVLLADSDRAVAEQVAKRIRNVVFSTTLQVDAKIVRVRVGVGVACYPEDGSALSRLLGAADRAAYEDKYAREPPKGRLVIRRR